MRGAVERYDMKSRIMNILGAGVIAAAVLSGSVPYAAAAISDGQYDQHPTKDQVQQKIRFVRMLATQSKLAYRLAHSGDVESQKMLHDARDQIKDSQRSLDAGDLDGAAAHADKSLEMMTAAAKRLPKNTNTDYRLRYKELMDAVVTYKDSYDRNYRRMAKVKGAKAVGEPLDEKAFTAMVDQAKAAAGKGDLKDADRLLATAQRRITKALTVLLNGQTLVYTKTFDSPKQEYEYESSRHKSYADLIPRAIRQHQPSRHAMELIHKFVNLSDTMETEATKEAREGDYKGAIETLQEATNHLQHALWVAGVRWSKWPE